mmetsp:Transcript_17948/g.15861  ORF Transcript_17948/g.15861 Transcript_17948/m.15861 type:complete len:110 (-) Transcript_17948:2052-2381(-)
MNKITKSYKHPENIIDYSSVQKRAFSASSDSKTSKKSIKSAKIEISQKINLIPINYDNEEIYNIRNRLKEVLLLRMNKRVQKESIELNNTSKAPNVDLSILMTSRNEQN